MRAPLLISVLLHVAAILLALFGLPRLVEDRIVEDSPMIVDLVRIDEKTVQRTTPKPVQAPEPDKPPPPKAAEKTPAPKPEAAKPAPRPVEAQPAPPPARPEPPKPEPAKPEAPKLATAPPPPPRPEPPAPEPPKLAAAPPPPAPPAPAPKPEPVKTPPPPPPEAARPTPPKTVLAAMPQPKRKPEPPKPKEQPLDLSRIAALLDKRQPKAPAPDRSEQPEKQESMKIASSRASDRPLSLTVIDSIRKQIENRWLVPAGARDAQSLVVSIHVRLQEDGTVLRAEVLPDPRLLSDSFYRAAADSALRAVKLASPLKDLPLDRYEQWRELTLNFNPKEMLGG